jgi:hypothetical protein
MEDISAWHKKAFKHLQVCLILTCIGLSYLPPCNTSQFSNEESGRRLLLSQTYSASNLTGMVAIWNGSIASIPAGWLLCNGSSGTPNLTNRFVQGVEFRELPGKTGGSTEHNHTYYELPRHAHSINDPGHAHYFTSKMFTDGPIGDTATPNSANKYAYDYGTTK